MGFKALLVGINDYKKQPLRGCLNDVSRMRNLLQQKYNLADDNLRVLLDSAATRQGIIDGLHWLAEADDSDTPGVRLFHFSGHGIHVADEQGDEADGQDEAIAPHDHETAGVLTDDSLRDIYAGFPPDTHLLLTMDCCHSGTIFGVPVAEPRFDAVYRYMAPDYEEQQRIWEAKERFQEQQQQQIDQLNRDVQQQKISQAAYNEKVKALQEPPPRPRFGQDGSHQGLVLIAACKDSQIAADARFDERYNGALTHYLTSFLHDSEKNVTYASLIEHLAHIITDNKFTQEPQLTCSEENQNRPFLMAIQRSFGMTAEPPAPDENVMQELPPEFFEGLLPFYEEEEAEGVEGGRGVGVNQFLYIGKGLKASEFADYVNNYNFGSQPPNFVVIHHTSVPDTQQAKAKHGTWDANEAGLSEQQIYQKRQRQLTGIREYYRTHLGWDRGPHLFIDDRWIWLFTPMYHMGIHAAGGNGFREGGRINYSIGIEVVGHYTHVQWPAPVAVLVGHAVAALKHKLGTFELNHQPFVGGVSSHRDYNKPSCPGDAITNDFYIGVLREGWSRFRQDGAPAPTPAVLADISPDMPILGPDSGTMQQAVAYIKQQLPASSEYSSDVEIIMGYYWQYAPGVGLDPFLAACQCIFETDALRSRWAGRPRRNPAGLGVRQEGGLSFETWEDAVQAHIGQLLAYALTDEEANEAQRQMMSRNPRHHRIPADHRGQAKTLTGLNNRWTDNPQYADGLVSRAQAVRGA